MIRGSFIFVGHLMMVLSLLAKLKWLGGGRRKMVRETDEEVFARIKKEKEESKEKEVPDMNKQKDDSNEEENTQEIPPQIIEREINLSLINDKLNFIISKLQQ